MRKSVPLAVILCMGIFTSLAFAWNGTGHMTVAYIAYKNLDNQTRARVDTLLRLNPVYPTWVKGIAPANRGLAAFLQAATWPDCIKDAKKCPGYQEDGTDHGETPPTDGTADQNIGYKDMAMHKYWHFVDEPFSTAGVPTVVPKVQMQSYRLGYSKRRLAVPLTTRSNRMTWLGSNTWSGTFTSRCMPLRVLRRTICMVTPGEMT